MAHYDKTYILKILFYEEFYDMCPMAFIEMEMGSGFSAASFVVVTK